MRRARRIRKGLHMFRIVAALILALTVSTVPVYAADESASPATTPVDFASAIKSSNTMSRPAALPALYVSYAALQVFDVYSTRQALAQGAREANPLMAPVVRNRSAFWAVKTSAAVVRSSPPSTCGEQAQPEGRHCGARGLQRRRRGRCGTQRQRAAQPAVASHGPAEAGHYD